MQNIKNQRQSGVELLKIAAILLIVISHVTQTLFSPNTYVGFQDYIYEIGKSTGNIQEIIINYFYYFGMTYGNTIFFVCSAWFLVGKKTTPKRKALKILIDVWVVSVIWLLVFIVARHGNLPAKIVIESLFPTTFDNNWYMTCYLVFLFIFPFLNMIIERQSQRQLLRIVFISSLLWIFISYVIGTHFFYTHLMAWIAIYFIIAYVKLYMPQFQNSRKANIINLLIGILGPIGLIFITNYLGYRISVFSTKLLYWNNNNSPFGILTALGALNLCRQMKFKCAFVNYVSSLSMLAYLIHENILFRSYTRPAIWRWIYNTFGYSHIIICILAFSIALFVLALIASAIYKETIQKLTSRVAMKIYNRISIIWTKAENWAVTIK